MNGLKMKKENFSAAHIRKKPSQALLPSAHSLWLTFQCVGLKEPLTPYTERPGARAMGFSHIAGTLKLGRHFLFIFSACLLYLQIPQK